MTITYDENNPQRLGYDINGLYNMEEMAAIVEAFKRCVSNWGYDVKMK